MMRNINFYFLLSVCSTALAANEIPSYQGASSDSFFKGKSEVQISELCEQPRDTSTITSCAKGWRWHHAWN